jgi:uncharacterized surface protein with fasciclin (FAS1) repeats
VKSVENPKPLTLSVPFNAPFSNVPLKVTSAALP